MVIAIITTIIIVLVIYFWWRYKDVDPDHEVGIEPPSFDESQGTPLPERDRGQEPVTTQTDGNDGDRNLSPVMSEPSLTPEPEPAAEEPESAPEPVYDPVSAILSEVIVELKVVLEKFRDVISVNEDGLTYAYLVRVATEAYAQYYYDLSPHGIPLLYREDIFVTIVDYYGDKRDRHAAFYTMLGWIVALHLAELCPQKRNQLLPIGYKAGCYDMNSSLYGYDFDSDPNVSRIVAGAILSVMRGVANPDIEAMRSEVGGNAYDRSVADIANNENRYNVADDGFYVDFRKFLCTAPGPYAVNYRDRSNLRPTWPDEKTDNGCLKVDMDIHQHIVETLNLDNQQAVQAIADKDWDVHHLFGADKHGVGGKYDFRSVFGESSIGINIDPDSELASWLHDAMLVASHSRSILQHNNPLLGAIEYGRLRPGCSWDYEAVKHSTTDDRQNVLVDFDIEDGDGNPTGYYDENGVWVKPDVCSSPEEYKDFQQTQLWANSYPSGHSSGIVCLAYLLMERNPSIADKILKAAISFSLNRNIARYHWTSDAIQGRIVGSAMASLVRATK